jgi:hypothetical protein
MQPAPPLADGWIPVTPAFAGAGKHRDDSAPVVYEGEP